jgi:hypothetical protein
MRWTDLSLTLSNSGGLATAAAGRTAQWGWIRGRQTWYISMAS